MHFVKISFKSILDSIRTILNFFTYLLYHSALEMKKSAILNVFLWVVARFTCSKSALSRQIELFWGFFYE